MSYESHLTAVVALIPSGLTTYDTSVPGKPTFPYVLVTAPEFSAHLRTLSDKREIDDTLQVTCVGLDARQARYITSRVRAVLDGAKPNVSGFNADLKRLTDYASPALVDFEVTLPDGSHPTYVVDTYRYVATPS